MNTKTKTNRRATRSTLVGNHELRDFLKSVRAGQCLALAAWATAILRAGDITDTDLQRCFALGFHG